MFEPERKAQAPSDPVLHPKTGERGHSRLAEEAHMAGASVVRQSVLVALAAPAEEIPSKAAGAWRGLLQWSVPPGLTIPFLDLRS